MAEEATEVAEQVEQPQVEESTPAAPPTDQEQMLNPGDEQIPPGAPEKAEAGVEKGDEQEAAKDEPAISPALLEQAKAFGWDEDVVKGLDPVQLERMILRAQVNALRQPADKKADEKQVEPPQEFKVEFSDDFDPEAKKAIESLHGHYAEEVKGLKSQLNEALGYIQEQRMQALDERMTGLFNGLQTDYGETFGKGNMSEVTGSPAGKLRDKVLEQMDTLAMGYQARGQKIPNEKELFRAAVAIVSPLDVNKVASKKLNETLSKGKKNLFVRPANRDKATDEPGEEKAKKSVAALMEKYKESGTKFE